MSTDALPNTVREAQALILAELQAHPFIPLTHFQGSIHPRLLHEAVFTLSTDRRVNVTNGHLHIASADHTAPDAALAAAEHLLKVLRSEHHPRTSAWLELALPVELSHAVTDALGILLIDGKIAALKSPHRPDRYYLV